MTWGDIANASKPIQRLIGKEMPLKIAFDVKVLADALNPFLEEYERKLKETEKEKLDSTEVEFKIKIAIPLDAPIMLAPYEIKLLEPFIDFYIAIEGGF